MAVSRSTIDIFLLIQKCFPFPISLSVGENYGNIKLSQTWRYPKIGRLLWESIRYIASSFVFVSVTRLLYLLFHDAILHKKDKAIDFEQMSIYVVYNSLSITVTLAYFTIEGNKDVICYQFTQRYKVFKIGRFKVF